MSSTQQLVPVFSVVSNNFEKDLGIIKQLFSGFEKLTRTEHGYKLSEQATLAAGWWFYEVYFTEEFAKKTFELILPGIHNARLASNGMTAALEGQLRKYGSEAKIRIHKDVQLAAIV